MTPYPQPYDADYFLHGQSSGKSLYTDYRWVPDLTIPMVKAMIGHLGILPHHKVLDFGCARGYTVRAFLELGYDAWGIDVSEWAIANCDPVAKDSVVCGDAAKIRTGFFDWVIAKDVLEHVPQVEETVNVLMERAGTGVFAVIPLAPSPEVWGPVYELSDREYVVPDYENDVTHLHRLALEEWFAMFARPGWAVTASYRVPGIKENYSQYPTGNGFITCRRLSCP